MRNGSIFIQTKKLKRHKTGTVCLIIAAYSVRPFTVMVARYGLIMHLRTFVAYIESFEIQWLYCKSPITIALCCSHNTIYILKFGFVKKLNSLTPLTHWGRDKMAAIFLTTFSNEFSWRKMFEFRLRFHWNLFLRVQLTIFQHWFR